MRLYLSANTNKQIGYTPDWLKVSYEENGRELELTLDVQGEIDYMPDGLDCRCKGDLVPWVLWDCEDGDETDLSELPENEVDERYPIKKLAEILKSSNQFVIGLYPVNLKEDKAFLANEDVFSDCKGTCELYDGNETYEICFTFEAEINL